MPTSGHFIFIPAVFLTGAFLGFIFGLRAKADQQAMEEVREEQRKQARIERAARKAKRAQKERADDSASGDGERSDHGQAS